MMPLLIMSHVRLSLSVVVLTLLPWVLQAQIPPFFDSQPTNLLGRSDKIISSRFQNHSGISPNGRYLLVLNSGIGDSALRLVESRDGVDWRPTRGFQRTNADTTSDVAVHGDWMWITYVDDRGVLMLERFIWWSPRNRWVLISSDPILPPRTRPDRPTLAIDDRGGIWFAVSSRVAADGFGQILIYRHDVFTGQTSQIATLGSFNQGRQKSGRILFSNGWIHVVYTNNPVSEADGMELRYARFSVETLALEEDIRLVEPFEETTSAAGAHFSAEARGDHVHCAIRVDEVMTYLRVTPGAASTEILEIPFAASGVRPYPDVALGAEPTELAVVFPIALNGLNGSLVQYSRNNGESFEAAAFVPWQSSGNNRLEALTPFTDFFAIWAQTTFANSSQSLLFQNPPVPAP